MAVYGWSFRYSVRSPVNVPASYVFPFTIVTRSVAVTSVRSSPLTSSFPDQVSL